MTNQINDPEILERLNQLKERWAQRRAAEAQEAAKIVLQPERRGENLRLLRAYMGGATQERFGRMLKISSQSMYSSYERSEPPLPKEDARRIESELKLPNGWFERNNTEALFLGADELALTLELKECTPDATTSLLAAVRSIRTQRES